MWQVKNQTTFTSGAADLLFNCILVQICSKIELFFFFNIVFLQDARFFCTSVCLTYPHTIYHQYAKFLFVLFIF